MTTPWEPADDPLVDLTDRARATDAVTARTTRRDLAQRTRELATLAGTLRDLAERRVGATLGGVSGRNHQGTVVALATDHVVLQAPSGRRVYVRLDAIATVRPDPCVDAPIAGGDRDAAEDVLLAERCARWVADRPQLAVALDGTTELVHGRLVGVGEDVLTLTADGSGNPVYVAVGAVHAVVREP